MIDNKNFFLEDEHGGDLLEAQKKYKDVSEWIDLSSGINPHPYKDFKLAKSIYNSLPSGQAIRELLSAAAVYYKLKDDSSIIAYQGAQGLINIFPYIFSEIKKKKVQVYSPTYIEHYKSWVNAGYTIKLIVSFEKEIDPSGITIIVNPNNPDGKLFNKDALIVLQNRIQEKNGLLIIDESFMDPTPDEKFNYSIEKKNLIIIRSFGKFFGLPGLRLGFAFGDHKYINQISNFIGPWPISSSSIDIALKAMSDIQWIKQTINQLEILSKDLELALNAINIPIIGGTLLFKLVKFEDAGKIHNLLAKDGIWTRKFIYNNNWLRLGIPKDRVELNYLFNSLQNILK